MRSETGSIESVLNGTLTNFTTLENTVSSYNIDNVLNGLSVCDAHHFDYAHALAASLADDFSL